MQRILVGLDNSPKSAAVLRAALHVAHAEGAKIIVLHALPITTELPAEARELSPDEAQAFLEARERAAIEAYLVGVPRGVLEAVYVRPGTAWHSLCNAAEEEKADLIVVGAHGHRLTRLDRVLGTTAAKVVDHAACSVLVVRETA